LKNVYEFKGAPPLYECMMQEETLILVSDGGAKGTLESFGWGPGHRQGDRYVEAHGITRGPDGVVLSGSLCKIGLSEVQNSIHRVPQGSSPHRGIWIPIKT
jgi:hypothetical protein